ncbi:hypothetical protein R50072_08540 [Simiduia litorea]|uniref:cupin domain-containing protein n=1 Tax=Simiduia litorea TaxID=1435348 RepID=UPI0036F43AA4
MKLSTQTLFDFAAVFTPKLDVASVPTGPGMYEALDRNFDHFKGHLLVSCYDFSEPWGSWERHPAGDEIVILLSGRVEFVVRGQEGDESVWLGQAGGYLVIPQGVWHTAKTSEPSRLLFMTPGEGTEHAQNPQLL